MKRSIKTTCCYCGVGCGILLHEDYQGRLQIEGDKEHPVNHGMLCSKGMNLNYTLADQSDRLQFPQMRYARHLPLKRVSWDQALDRASAVFRSLIQEYGPDSVAFYVSGQCLTEEYYVANKLMKGFIGSNNIDSNSRLCMSSAVTAYKMALGEDSVPGCYEDLELADCIFVAGGNPAWCHPILWRRVEEAKKARPELKIIVSDPRKTQTSALADLHIQLNPGTDLIFHQAVGRALLEAGVCDNQFVQHHTEGFDSYRLQVLQKTIPEAAAICDIPEEHIRQTASFIGKSRNFLSLWTMGLNQSIQGVEKCLSLINLHLITGQIGKPGSGPFSLTGQPNAMGGREVGGLSNLLPAHRRLDNLADREAVRNFWNSGPISPKPGLSATEIIDALQDGRLKALWILGTNPLVSLPDVRRAEKAFAMARFLVVQEISNKPETLHHADLILPAASWAEKEGTMTNSERRITYLEPLLQPPAEALPDSDILCRFARKMGFSGFDYRGAEEIFLEHARLTENTHLDISGLDYSILREKRSVQWPFPRRAQGNGSPRLFEDGIFYTESGKACIHPCEGKQETEKPSPDLPLILTTGRIRDQWHTMSKTGKVVRLQQHISRSFLEIHPEDAAAREIGEQDLVEVLSPRGQVRVRAKHSTDIKKGVVFLPMHWGRILDSDLNRANNLTTVRLDPLSKEPDLKYSTVEVRRYRRTARRILVIGAGAGAFAFAEAYGTTGLEAGDRIEIFSKEPHPFYNRVLLPEYLNGEKNWSQLVKMKEEGEKHLGIHLHRGLAIEQIDRQGKRVQDSEGSWHPYDILVLATGSRAAVLRDLPELKGLYTLRTREDADQLRRRLSPGKGPVLIVGGGLLGIETAAALREMDLEVKIIHRSSRLMDRQLDFLGSQLLQEDLEERGVEVLYNEQLERLLGNKVLRGVQLKSGRELPCQALLMAIGTVPNIELAKDCGLICKRGVLVNEYLQSSDSSIYAVGEIAEFRGRLYGITAAAEEQACVLASHLEGDCSSLYQGSLNMNILKMKGSTFCSLGQVETPAGDPSCEEILFLDKSLRYYKKCLVKGDRLIGAILIGDNSEFQEFRKLIGESLELSGRRKELLRSGKKAEPISGKLLCSCGGVGEGNIVQRIQAGITNLEVLCRESGAGLGCGSCKPELNALLQQTLARNKKSGKRSVLEQPSVAMTKPRSLVQEIYAK